MTGIWIANGNFFERRMKKSCESICQTLADEFIDLNRMTIKLFSKFRKEISAGIAKSFYYLS